MYRLSEKVCYRTTYARIFGRVVFRSRTDAPTIVTTVRAHVANNSVSVNDVPLLIASVYGALAALGDTQGHASAVPAATQKPAVTVRASIKPDRLICLEDGLSMTMLKRHLNTHHQLTPAQYRAKWICRATIRWSRPITAR